MRILFYFGHPAQYLFLRASLKRLNSKGHEIKILIKTKDVLEDLLSEDGFPYTNILRQERGRSKLAIAKSLAKRSLVIFPILIKFKPDLIIGTDASIAQLGMLLNINRITITEDDYDVIKTLGKLTYPFTQTILCPSVCEVGRWEKKKIGYDGYMKLGYLHPNVFQDDLSIKNKYNLPEKYVLIRLAKLTAHHDFGVKGIDFTTLDRIILSLEKHSIAVFLSVEGDTREKYQKYLLDMDPSDMHHLLSKATLLISDSQSMSVEASMLGVPSIRISDFVGKISVLEELEQKYLLTFGVNPKHLDPLFSKMEELLNFKGLKQEFLRRKEKMLTDKIDVTAFLTWFISNYPSSAEIMKKNKDYQYKFR